MSEKKNSRKATTITMLLSFFVPTVIMALALFNTDIYPGGRNTVLIYDGKAQFLPLNASLRYLINGESSFLYSFLGGLGTNALPNYSMYLLNPFAWITVFFPLEKLADVFYYETLVEIGLCGLTFSIFLLKGRNGERNYYSTLLFSCFYALMSYNIMYSMVLPWLLVVALFPLTLLGIEQIINGKKGGLYVFSLTWALALNYQMAYMTGFFCVLYILFRITETKIEVKKLVIRFSICSLLALGLYLPLFIPSIASLFGGRLTSVADNEGGMFYYPIWKVLNQLFSCRYDMIDAGGLPSLFCGTVTVFLVLLYVVMNYKKKWNVIAAVSIILFYFFGMVFAPLNRFLHGFVEPNAYPARYTYVFCGFLIILAYEAMLALVKKINSPSSIKVMLGTVVALVLLSEQYLNAAYIISSNNVEKNYALKLSYNEYIKITRDLLDHISDDSFYRIGHAESKFSTNEGELFGVNELSYFSSAYSVGFMNAMGLMGMFQSEHYFEDLGSTPFMDGILGVKYKISNFNRYDEYEKIYSNSNYMLWYNEHALSPGFVFGGCDNTDLSALRLLEKKDSVNAFKYQEVLFNDIFGNDETLYDEIEYSITDIDDDSMRHVKISFESSDERPIWIYCPLLVDVEKSTKEVSDDFVTINKANGKTIMQAVSKLASMCTYVGRFKPGEKVEIELKEECDFGNPILVSFDEEKCFDYLDRLKEYSWNVEKHHNGVLEGTIDSPYENSYMMITLPLMDGYQIYVDGVKTEYYSYKGVFPLIPISKGNHMVKVSFYPPGLTAGIICGIGATLLLLIYFRPVRKK